MKIDITVGSQETSLRKRIKHYRAIARDIQNHLAAHPTEWGRFQSQFNQEINGIFRDLMIFEKKNLARGNEDRVYKLKRLFVRHFRNDFVRGRYLERSLKKPLGYAGDYRIIDDIYQNDPQSEGFDRLYDNYFQMSAICVAVRNRKEDFKEIILNAVRGAKTGQIKIMDLASGPCRDVVEVLDSPLLQGRKITFDCYENDERAVEYSRTLLRNDRRVRFVKQNVVRLALKKEIKTDVPESYNLIYSSGLFDYLDYRVSVRLVSNLKRLLQPGGLLAISDVRDKFSNPSIYFMEWVADWNLIYRDDDNFKQIFLDAGFLEKDLSRRYEQQGIMQYVIAENKPRP